MSTITLDPLHVMVIVILTFLAVCIHYHTRRFVRLPPGPKPLPLVGNIHQMPIEYQEKTFYEWGKTYGDIIYAQVFQKSFIVVNSLEVARDLMEKRSGNYSSRPKMTMMSDILGWDTLTLVPYGNRCRKMRKWTQEAFQKKESLARCRPIQRREAGRTLLRLLVKPERFSVILTTFAASMIMEVTYGHQVKSEDDHFIKIAELALDVTAKIGGHGSSLIDFFPILQHYPLWAPGSWFMREAMHARKLVQNVINAPYDMVKTKLLAAHQGASAWSSMVGNLLENHLREGKIAPEEEADIRGAAATIYGAGTETTATVLKTFVLVMVRQPEVFQKLQREMDQVVGLERLPDFDDRLALPYLNAVIKELYRWQIPVPLGIPHMVAKDDEYRGYSIPGQSMLIANIWGMSRDESIYHQPHEFLPERYLDEMLSPEKVEVMDPKNLVFGFGRRLCPGKDFADSSIYIMLAYVTATMNITKAKDEIGNDITPPAEFESGSSSRPKPFRCAISPRSAMVANLIRQTDVSY